MYLSQAGKKAKNVESWIVVVMVNCLSEISSTIIWLLKLDWVFVRLGSIMMAVTICCH